MSPRPSVRLDDAADRLGRRRTRVARRRDRQAMTPPRSPWPLVWLLYLSGLLAAAQRSSASRRRWRR